jgi:hypothetical protein
MKTGTDSRLHVSTTVGLLTVVVLAVTTSAQQRPQYLGLPEDWTHRHLVFANPGTYVQMLDPKVSQDRWLAWVGVQKDPRFLLHLAKRQKAGMAVADATELAIADPVGSDSRFDVIGRDPVNRKKKQPVGRRQPAAVIRVPTRQNSPSPYPRKTAPATSWSSPRLQRVPRARGTFTARPGPLPTRLWLARRLRLRTRTTTPTKYSP